MLALLNYSLKYRNEIWNKCEWWNWAKLCVWCVEQSASFWYLHSNILVWRVLLINLVLVQSEIHRLLLSPRKILSPHILYRIWKAWLYHAKSRWKWGQIMKMTWGNVTFTISNREKRHFPEYGIFLEFTTSVFRWALGQAAPASCMSSAKGIWTRSKQNGLLQNFSSMSEPRRKLFAGLWEVPAVRTGSTSQG